MLKIDKNAKKEHLKKNGSTTPVETKKGTKINIRRRQNDNVLASLRFCRLPVAHVMPDNLPAPDPSLIS